MQPDLKRRILLGASLGGLATACAPLRSRPVRFSDNPFLLGVASGDAGTDGMVLWTRLLTDLAYELQPVGVVAVDWELAADAAMRQVLRRGTVLAEPAWAHSVHVEVAGLEPGREYFYRFRAGGQQSPLGRTRTLPVNPQQVQLALTSCQHYERGWFGLWQRVLEDDPHQVLFVGDYIYETNETSGAVRRHLGPEPTDLRSYRRRHALYKTDPHLQRAHQHLPFVLTWDDHEVDNDYAGLANQDWDSAAEFRLRRNAAYQAYYEHQPLRSTARPREGAMEIHREVDLGGMGRILVLDSRQYRDPQACRITGEKPGRLLPADCNERTQAGRSYLGLGQEAWLRARLGEPRQGWNLLLGAQPFNRLKQVHEGQARYWSDDWNGYAAARDQLLRQLREQQVSNPVFLGGDIHTFWANDIVEDHNHTPLASEFITAAITSNSPGHDRFVAMLPDNPQVQYFEGRYQGYTKLMLDQQGLRADFMAVDRSVPNDPPRQQLSGWRVQAGRPGVQAI